jgi:hypothetical protein
MRASVPPFELGWADDICHGLSRKEAAAGYNIAPQRDFANHLLYTRDPKITIAPKNLDFGRPYGWPAKPGPVIGEIDVIYVLPDMVAKAVSGSSINEAMTWCEEQLNKIVKSQRT